MIATDIVLLRNCYWIKWKLPVGGLIQKSGHCNATATYVLFHSVEKFL